MLNPAESAHLIVFGRYPRVGMTKTRLIPALGPAGAAALQKRLAEKTVATARQAAMRIGARLVFCHDGGNAQQLCQWLGGRPIRYLAQAAGDLGRRMHLAMQRAFDVGARRVVLVGTDIPGLTTEMLEEAFSALHEKDLVFGPSIDGGYWLVGMAKPENIFAGIVWSRPDVLEKSLALARKKGMTSHLLAPLNDLDTPDDLAREWGSDHVPPPYLSVIIPTIDEAQQMPRTLAAAASPDAEIIVSDGGSTRPHRANCQLPRRPHRRGSAGTGRPAKPGSGRRARRGAAVSPRGHPAAPQLCGSCVRNLDGPAHPTGGVSLCNGPPDASHAMHCLFAPTCAPAGSTCLTATRGCSCANAISPRLAGFRMYPSPKTSTWFAGWPAMAASPSLRPQLSPPADGGSAWGQCEPR